MLSITQNGLGGNILEMAAFTDLFSAIDLTTNEKDSTPLPSDETLAKGRMSYIFPINHLRSNGQS